MKQILLHPSDREKLANEFAVSRQTVYAALRYFNNSQTAQAIRQRSKELLLNESNKVQISINEDVE
ncbi:hypothetical protein [Flavobacterium sp. HSC-61S13]|uniref:hypothetical protein n=1 Tax=Flavobacterium sp. HSC-61S13 TaxID=2910963 RepID=UPI00209E9E7E|nr:hypothetical protein [Flavobacterium sp. HSC-61S13]